MTPVSDIIQKRYSCRSYADKPISSSVLRQFSDAVNAPRQGPFGHTPRFVLISMASLSREDWKKLGTYGVIKNARLFLAGILQPTLPMAAQDYGYCKEQLILKATELGLGTCWMGGTFSIGAFGRAAGLRPGELLPSISPIGYAADKRSLMERVMRRVAGSDYRKPWSELFFNGIFSLPLHHDEAGSYAEALENVRLAPSASNKQPWRIVCKEDRKTFSFYLSRTPGYWHPQGVSLQDIDMGIAMCHFELTAQQLGLKGSWRREDSVLQIKSLEYVVSWQIGD